MVFLNSSFSLSDDVDLILELRDLKKNWKIRNIGKGRLTLIKPGKGRFALTYMSLDYLDHVLT